MLVTTRAHTHTRVRAHTRAHTHTHTHTHWCLAQASSGSKRDREFARSGAKAHLELPAAKLQRTGDKSRQLVLRRRPAITMYVLATHESSGP
eukprot:1148597-Pelagomonas_calceolata.AAC.4